MREAPREKVGKRWPEELTVRTPRATQGAVGHVMDQAFVRMRGSESDFHKAHLGPLPVGTDHPFNSCQRQMVCGL